MSKKVPDTLRKALFKYIEKSEDENVDNLLKSCFPNSKVYNEDNKDIIPKKEGAYSG